MTRLFTVYRSSAGSGKTYTLAREFLKLALQYRSDYFKHILAVTFTNKSTQEMKDRILACLDDFASGRANPLADELKQLLNLNDQTFRERSEEVQTFLLHKYSQFSVSTIDAFFQKVIRSFTREAGLVGDYRLEVEQDTVLEDVINNLIDELGAKEELTKWVVDFANENLANERAWDVRQSLLEFSKEIFKEEFKQIEDDILHVSQQKDYFTTLRTKLQETKWSFLNYVTKRAREAVEIIERNGLEPDDFKYQYSPGYSFFAKLTGLYSVTNFVEPSATVKEKLTDPKNWPRDKRPRISLVYQLAVKELLPRMTEILEHREKYYTRALSAEIALNNFYAFGLVADISRKLKEYKDENNMMLLADAPKFLNGVIQDSDTPFIYEKVGSFYRNYLIDEFQDTSGFQWKNFLPLLTNSLDQGYPSMVVGDVKQAIYRWRGGDLDLLQQQVEKQVGQDRVTVHELLSNYRSGSNIITFNNSVFKAAAKWMTNTFGVPVMEDVYKDVVQNVSTKEAGFVRVKFIEEKGDDDSWKEQSRKLIPEWLEQLQESGVALKNIAILVRRNDEGQQIVADLLHYRASGEAKENCRYDVVSNESLRIDGASSVNLILAALAYLLNTDNVIARAQLAYEYERHNKTDRPYTEVFAVSNNVFFEESLPESFTRQKSSLKKLPLYELTETLIQIFGLSTRTGELAYLQAFQDLVLEFSSRERNDLGEFLEWWEDNKHGKSIQASGEIDAVQILTIHKAKGLQFDYVIIPFCSWSLDHESFKAPMLWVKADEEPFRDIGYIPVRYASALKNTFFESYYERELIQTHLDNLNLLYVALTRARLGLIVQAPHPGVRYAKKTIAQVLYESILQAENLEGWDNVAQQFQKGALTAVLKKDENNRPPLTLKIYETSSWRDKLVIRQSAGEFFEPDQADARQRINFGIYVHGVLSRIKYSSDVDNALNQMMWEGFITEEERKPLLARLEILFSHEQVRSWFSDDWEIRTEVPILLPEGKESRIDRLLIKGSKAIVIDFKTGDPVKHDQAQVQHYITTLHQMNYPDVEGFLLYVRSGEIVAVKAGRPKVVKKKDSNQLELGL
ncbi:MAG TPA: UvrD-helicase domain-containing protein [Cyclobacteriaceae bacterium]|nr:UvrD-helicase domain-containing protein [Cyclobacteriaceae bacterium]